MSESTEDFVYRMNIAHLSRQIDKAAEGERKTTIGVILTEEHLKSEKRRQDRSSAP